MMMGSQERSRKKNLSIWKKALLHFLLCFVMGFFTATTTTTKALRSQRPPLSSPEPLLNSHTSKRARNDQKLVIIVSPTSKRNKLLRNVMLTRLASTLRLVAQPLVWVVVEPNPPDPEVSQILRKTGIMYRHVVSDEDFIDEDAEIDHQRNLALSHIEHHRLSGVVHFAGLSNVYDLSFFQEIRAIEAFGAWPVAKMVANSRKVMMEGRVCDSWKCHFNNIHISSFAFNSTILWDPERWGRRTFPTQDAPQNSLNYVRKEVVEEESTLKDIPTQGCCKVLLWELHIPKML
ncbi:beta-1,4-xylosyltransferase IRX9-like [Salvia splendens]|uniref:beta-1,4-xylosyltransferase IRX9-like n=1 Tax=Salvia splendens TaxID=180675 RepID=UPI001C27B95F|nr:beta-1,4-xylosyltransferase IRX9-like [Salvia splendens]